MFLLTKPISKKLRSPLLMTTVLGSTSAFAAISYHGEVALTARHDSNVAVNEIDQSVDESDTAAVVKAKLSSKWENSKGLSATAGVNHQQSHYSTLDDYDLALTTWHVAGAMQTDAGKWGLHHYFATATLGSQDFLTYQQTGMSWGKSFTPKTYLHVGVDHIQKDFDHFPQRDGEGNKLSIDGFIFTTTPNENFIVGASLLTEHANDDAFSYTGYQLRGTWTYPMQWWGYEVSFKNYYQFESRDYDSTDIGTQTFTRSDKHHTVESSLEMTMTEWATLLLNVKYADYRSNLSTADYSESQISTGVRFYF